jgi:uncharacterized membrane protein YgdD (TMEM256/DUF423 family)
MSTENKVFFVLGCIFLTAAGALATFGFHGPVEILTPEKRQSWGWAVDMQYYHGLGLLLIALLNHLLGPSSLIRVAGVMMTSGILIFAGLIYAESLGASESVGEIVPSGGFLLMLSWLALAAGVVVAKQKS